MVAYDRRIYSAPQLVYPNRQAVAPTEFDNRRFWGAGKPLQVHRSEVLFYLATSKPKRLPRENALSTEDRLPGRILLQESMRPALPESPIPPESSRSTCPPIALGSSSTNASLVVNLPQPLDRFLHHVPVDFMHRMNMTDALEHRQSQTAPEMLPELLKSFENCTGT